jgi:hypothetical protein
MIDNWPEIGFQPTSIQSASGSLIAVTETLTQSWRALPAGNYSAARMRGSTGHG